MATDSTRLFEDRSAIELAGSDMTRMAAKEAFTKAKIGPDDVQVIELHDCCKLDVVLIPLPKIANAFCFFRTFVRDSRCERASRV